ncbi:NADH-quinone oxidoreductase subunit E [Pontibacter aydingkolensis]|uniref:NADH-quinone oxidoreductase subunit NuoE n=1 Tax=Pontibacter aydingkolensis TaxID=1911536 RepID=A0ABS7CXU6_9BACT|nr:NADH-quinone oxidoreductase subunit NuoE [Pontibacter aydingkolensis]MBW7468650.1 NADH-quinone oxidoreductase subunit NuoE [Pontibacter aydingkolensis]
MENLTAEEIEKIEHEISLVPVKKAACIEALKVVQQHRGWVSDESIKAVADLMDMSPAELDSVATFYNLIFRQPVGRHVILVCDSISCWVVGYENIREYLTAKLGIQYGQTTPDGRFTMLPNVCLGCCDHAPALMIDNDLYKDLEPNQLDEILNKYA